MKIVSVLSVLILLVACSHQEGAEQLDCYGTNINGTIGKGAFIKENQTHNYRFFDFKLEGYDLCEYSKEVILCTNTQLDEKSIQKRQLAYEKETGSFFEIKSIRARSPVPNAEGELLNRDVYIGHCEQPLYYRK